MTMTDTIDAEGLLHAQAENPKMRPRDLARQLNVPEAALVAAQLGHGARRITAHPDALMPYVKGLGTVMALTRNESAVHEKIGVYDNYHSGTHAAMVLTQEIDLRIFPKHWRHAFAVEKETPSADIARSVQVFDAAGDAVHKIILRQGSSDAGWQALRDAPDLDALQEAHPTYEPRPVTEPARADISRVDVLRKEWAQMTDTHQFMRLTSKLKMNRLGAYQIAGAPFAERLEADSFNTALEALSAASAQVMVFVGNRGCIQIHSGAVDQLRQMGPWQNVMDPEFNLHLRLDHIAHVWRVQKPTKRGAALSLEAFDAEGGLILQCFGLRKESGPDHSAAFTYIANQLPSLDPSED